ncbi:MAG TPA: hypothetical protein VFH95_05355 [Candidatus Kapabacteria bacterium]|nr:hypothetical protein [Candidatus Kapabacteria bacterium]
MIRNRFSHGDFIRRSRMLVVILATLGLSAVSAWAQTGKITAKIVDAKTGEPLIHAVIQILQNRMGALTHEDGVATIIDVPPSQNYTLIAKYVEYIPDTIYHVQVQSDITTALNLKLGKKGGIITVVAQAPMVEKTKTDISTKISSSEFASIAGRQRIDEIIKLTPGAVQDNSNGGISFHGSRGTSNSVRLNGVEITDPLTGRAGSLETGLSRLAISEVDIVTGSADASKGGFVGGEINTQTRSGGNNLDFTAHYRTEIPSLFGYSQNGFQQMPSGDKIYEFSLGGPLVTQDLKFFITGRLNTFDHYNNFTDPTFSNEGLGVIDPLGNNLGELPLTERYYRTGTAQLAFQALGFSVTANADLNATSGLLNSWTTLYEDPYYIPAEEWTNDVYSLNARGQIGDGVLELQGGYSLYDIQYGKYDHTQPVDITHEPQFLSTTDNYTYNSIDGTVSPGPDGIIDIYTPVTKQIPDPADPTKAYSTQVPGLNPFTGRIEGPAIAQTSSNAYGLVGTLPNGQQFIATGNPAGFLQQNEGQSQFSGNYTMQMGSHFITAGFESNFMSIYKYENDLPWDANPFKDSFLVHPYTGAIYASDKMEFSDITFAPGIRFDLYQPNSNAIQNLYDPLASPLTATPLQTQVSPRIAVTYAVTDQTTFNFGYNWYFKEPNLQDVLRSTAGGNAYQINLALQRGNQILGNAGLQAERTKEVDVGFNTQLSDIFAFSVTGIYKDLRNQSGLEAINSPLLAQSYFISTDDEYGNDRAIEVVAEKEMADNWSLKANYTYQLAQGTSSSATEAYSEFLNQDPSSEQAVLPLTPFPFSYDRTNVADILFNINYNKDEGPTIFGKKLLEWFSLNTTTIYQTGTPYTAVNLRGATIGSINGDRQPDEFQTDATLTRTIPFGDVFGPSMSSIFLDLQLEVTNVFDRVTPLQVYASTGQGDNDGLTGLLNPTQEFYNDPTNSRGGQIDPVGNLYYNPRLDLNHDGKVSLAEQQISYNQYRKDNYNRAVFYQIPRRVFLNFTLRF